MRIYIPKGKEMFLSDGRNSSSLTARVNMTVEVTSSNEEYFNFSIGNKKFLVQKENCVIADDYVDFGDIARGRLQQQCQYAVRYTGINLNGEYSPEYWESFGYKSLGENLRFIGDSGNYHSMKIHKDDVEEFVERYLSYQSERLRKAN